MWILLLISINPCTRVSMIFTSLKRHRQFDNVSLTLMRILIVHVVILYDYHVPQNSGRRRHRILWLKLARMYPGYTRCPQLPFNFFARCNTLVLSKWPCKHNHLIILTIWTVSGKWVVLNILILTLRLWAATTWVSGWARKGSSQKKRAT